MEPDKLPGVLADTGLIRALPHPLALGLARADEARRAEQGVRETRHLLALAETTLQFLVAVLAIDACTWASRTDRRAIDQLLTEQRRRGNGDAFDHPTMGGLQHLLAALLEMVDAPFARELAFLRRGTRAGKQLHTTIGAIVNLRNGLAHPEPTEAELGDPRLADALRRHIGNLIQPLTFLQDYRLVVIGPSRRSAGHGVGVRAPVSSLRGRTVPDEVRWLAIDNRFILNEVLLVRRDWSEFLARYPFYRAAEFADDADLLWRFTGGAARHAPVGRRLRHGEPDPFAGDHAPRRYLEEQVLGGKGSGDDVRGALRISPESLQELHCEAELLEEVAQLVGLTDLEALAGGRSLVFRGTRTAQSARGSSATGAAIRLPPAGTAVVVKTMRDATVENARVLREEFDLLQRIDDPHIVTAYDLIASTSARSYLVLRDVPGCTLATEIARRVATGRSFAPEEVCGIMCQILRGLRSLHAHATHGDIKPSNLMIDLTGRVTLIDLGNAVAAEDISTRTAVAGTRGYLAPEAFGAYECSEPWRADIFALGVIAYELFVGQLPRTDSVIHHTFDLDDHLRSIPRFWRIFIHWCGKQSPWKRPDTAEVLLDYLEHRAHAPEDIDGEVPHSTIIGRALAGSLRPFAVFTVVVFAILGFIHPAFWPLPAIAITIFARERTREISREGRSATQILTDSVSNIVLFCSALTKGALLAIATLFPLVALGAGLLVLAENDHLWTNAHPAEIIGVSIILSAPTVFAYRWLSRKGESLN